VTEPSHPTTLIIRGQTYITLRSLAATYELEVSWVREVYEYGLLGSGEAVDDDIAVVAAMLDRLAEVCRLHDRQGVNLAGIAIILDLLEDRR
jgi:hypothetical protein